MSHKSIIFTIKSDIEMVDATRLIENLHTGYVLHQYRSEITLANSIHHFYKRD